MITLIYNETRKLLSRKKTIVIFIAFTLLVGFIMFASYKNDQMRKKYNSPEYRTHMLQQSLDNLKKMNNDPKIGEQDKKQIELDIIRTEKELKDLKENPQPKEIDWKADLNKRIEESEKIINEPGAYDGDKERVKLEIDKYKYLLNNNIKYDEDNLNAFNFLNMLFSVLGAVFLAVGVMIFTGDMVSGEYTPPTMKFLITQPVSRGKVLFSKFISVVITSIILIMSVELVAYLLMGLIFGFGNPNYPMFVGTRYQFDLSKVINGENPLKVIAGSTYIIARWQFIIRALLLQVLFIIAAASVAFLLSTVLKSSMVSTSLSIVIVIVLAIFQELPYVKKAAPYIFTTYGNPFVIMQGNLPISFHSPIFTTSLSVIVLVVWSMVCYLISHLIFVKRDILI